MYIIYIGKINLVVIVIKLKEIKDEVILRFCKIFVE